MSRPNPLVLTVILLIFTAVFGGVALLKDGLYLNIHEGDSYHLLDILLRMERGQDLHQDFSSPLGILAFLPIMVFIDAGFQAGKAIIFSQLTVALLLLPFVIYAATSRMSRAVGYYFCLVTLGTAMVLTYGDVSAGVTISMHYNRWAWAIAFVILALALLPSRSHENPTLDGTLIGVLFGALALLKITFFVALAPGVAVALVLRWQGKGVVYPLIGGAVVALLATLGQGVAFWSGYLSDLLIVTGSEVRSHVGVPLREIIASPKYLGMTLLGFSGFFLLRRAGHEGLAGVIMLLVPGFIFITYQNFGNDPKWLWFLPVLFFTLRPEQGTGEVGGVDLRQVMGCVAWLALALNFPSLVKNATSTLEHATLDEARYIPMLPEEMGHSDIFVRIDRAYTMNAAVQKDREMAAWASYEEVINRPPLHELGGVAFEECEWVAGSRAHFEVFARDLIEAGVPEGSQLFTADMLSALWLFGPFEPLDKGAPWYYGNLTGLENADYVVIPKCTFVARIRGIMIQDLVAMEQDLELVRDNELYALFAVNRKVRQAMIAIRK